MATELKQPYLKAASKDKQRYLDELVSIELAKGKQTNEKVATLKEKAQNAAPSETNNNKSKNATPATETTMTPNPNPQPQQQMQQKQHQLKSTEADPDEMPPATILSLTRNKRTPTPTTSPTTTNVNPFQSNKTNAYGNGNITTGTTTQHPPPPTTPSEIQIFTNEFLEHNRNMDTEIRTLRKQHSDLEQHNALLDKYVENTSVGLAKINNDIADLKEQNRLLNQYLTQTKEKFIRVFASLPLPTERNGASSENFDKYMEDLCNMAASNVHTPSLNKARDIIRKLELPVRPKIYINSRQS